MDEFWKTFRSNGWLNEEFDLMDRVMRVLNISENE